MPHDGCIARVAEFSQDPETPAKVGGRKALARSAFDAPLDAASSAQVGRTVMRRTRSRTRAYAGAGAFERYQSAYDQFLSPFEAGPVRNDPDAQRERPILCASRAVQRT